MRRKAVPKAVHALRARRRRRAKFELLLVLYREDMERMLGTVHPLFAATEGAVRSVPTCLALPGA